MVKRKVAILLLGLSLFLSGQSVNAIQKPQDTSIEHNSFDLGYKSISDAVHDTEGYFKKNLDLPKKLPPLDFTHSFGRFNNPEGDQNDGLEIEYLNKDKHFNYIINVHPAKYGLKYNPDTDKKITLKDGTQAYYKIIGKKPIIVFMFEKAGWRYMLCIEERLLDKPISTLVDIANSF